MSFSKHKSIVVFSLIMGVLFFLLQWMEYKFMVRDLSTEALIGILAVVFLGLGVSLGIGFRGKQTVHGTPSSFSPIEKEAVLEEYNISDREFEVLELMAKGCSNQEIGAQLFISVSTVKSHSSKLYEKLEVNRRTQAVQKARELQIL